MLQGLMGNVEMQSKTLLMFEWLIPSYLTMLLNSCTRLGSFFAYISSVLIVSNNLGVLSANLSIVI